MYINFYYWYLLVFACCIFILPSGNSPVAEVFSVNLLILPCFVMRFGLYLLAWANDQK